MGGAGGNFDRKGGQAALALPAELVAEIEREARRARKPIGRWLAALVEDAKDARDGEAAWKRHLKSGARTIPAAQVYRDLGLDS